MKLLDRFRGLFSRSTTKAFTRMVHDGAGTFVNMLLPSTKRDYAKLVGDGLGSSVFAGPLNWLMRAFPEAPPMVEERNDDRQWEESLDHDLTTLLERPNPAYNGHTLWMVTILEIAFGNAYWLKVRNAFDEVIQLWWVPRGTMDPKWPSDGSQFISHYEYTVAGKRELLAPRDVVHFRFGLDPRNPRLGLSQLGSLAREVYTDDEAANFTASILKNLGVIGVVISPKEGTRVSEKDVKATKKYLKKKFSGDRRGQPLALGSPTEVNVMQYNLQGFDVSPIRDVSEERVCAALGIPAAVVGFGTGLQQTKVGATMRELRQLAWTGCLIPMQKILAGEIKRSLLPEFVGEETSRFRVRFDVAQVVGLWEDRKEREDRARKNYLSGGSMRSEFRREIGLSVDEERDEVFAQPTNIVVVDADGNQLTTGANANGEPLDQEGGDE